MLIRLVFFVVFAASTLQLTAKTKHYRIMFGSNPATDMTIGWNQQSGGETVVYYDFVPFKKHSEAQYRQEANAFVQGKGMNNGYCRLSGLIPNTVYYFVIKDNNSKSLQYSFQTMPSDNQALSIIAGGDSRNNRGARQKANALVSKLRPHFVLFGGDMTGGDSGKEWERWLDDWQLTIGYDGRMTPIVPARGNHEKSNKTIIEIFDVQQAGNYYAMTFGANLLRAYTLNSLIPSGGEQARWLENDLRNHQEMLWTCAQYHFPIRPHTRRKSERNEQWENWAFNFQKFGVDFVVECDAHCVKMTYPISPKRGLNSDQGFVIDHEQGTIYMGEGCWGAPLRNNNDDKSWTYASGSFNQFKWIFVRPERVEIRTVKVDLSQPIALDDNNRFAMPQGIHLWNPRQEGTVYTIYNKTFLANLPNTQIQYFNIEKQGEEALLECMFSSANPMATGQIDRQLDNGVFMKIADFHPSSKHVIYRDNTLGHLNKQKASYRIIIREPQQSDKIYLIGQIALDQWNDLPLMVANPQKRSVKIAYALEQAAMVEVLMYDTNSNVVWEGKYDYGKAGYFTKEIKIGGLKQGQYLIIARSKGQVLLKKQLVW